jgi:hypothetical protein
MPWPPVVDHARLREVMQAGEGLDIERMMREKGVEQ